MEYGNGTTNQLVWRETENRYHNEIFEVKPDNPNVNVAMVSQYVEAGEQVLDIGCGEGKFGKVLCDKRCRIYGVDLDQRAGKIAVEENGYEKVYFFNIEKPSDAPEDFWKFEKEDMRFDKIAILDVLEHVINPTAVIYHALKVLKNKGKLLISVPNVNNGDIFLNLLKDSFNYRTAGVLDNTHTKYFTKSSFIQWIKEMNDLNSWSLDCEYIGSTFAYTNYMEEVKGKYPAVYAFIQQNPYFHVMQHMFVLSYSETKSETPALDRLLEEKRMDLTPILEELICNSEKADVLEMVELLPNERQILEARAESAQKGWEKCAEALKQLKSFSEKQSSALSELNGQLKKKEEEVLEIKEKWEECAEALHDLNGFSQNQADALIDLKNELRKKENEILEITEKWEECAAALQAVRQENETIDILRSEVGRLEKEKQFVEDKWEECASALKETQRNLVKTEEGWKECAEALQKIKRKYKVD